MSPSSIDRIYSRIGDIMQKGKFPSSPATNKSSLAAFVPNHKGISYSNTQNSIRELSINKTYSPYAKLNPTQVLSKERLSLYASSPFSKKLSSLIEVEANKQNVAPELVKAMVQVESGGKPHALSPKGAMGLMQLMPETAKELGVNPMNPQENLVGGISYLKSMASRYGDLDLALAAYNAGPKAVDKYGGVPPYKETQQYIQSIRKKIGL